MNEAESRRVAIGRAFYAFWETIPAGLQPHLEHLAAFVAGFEAGIDYQKLVSKRKTNGKKPHESD